MKIECLCQWFTNTQATERKLFRLCFFCGTVMRQFTIILSQPTGRWAGSCGQQTSRRYALDLEDPRRDSSIQSAALRFRNKVFLSVFKTEGRIIHVKRHKIKTVLFGPQTLKMIQFTHRDDSLSDFVFEVSQASWCDQYSDDDNYGAFPLIITGDLEVFRVRSVPVSLCPPPDSNPALAVRSR